MRSTRPHAFQPLPGTTPPQETVYFVTPNLQVDMRVGVGLNRQSKMISSRALDPPPATERFSILGAGSRAAVQSQTWMRGLYQMPRYPSQTGAPRVQ